MKNALLSLPTLLFTAGSILVGQNLAFGQTPPQGSFTMAQTISDGAQRTTLAFDGLAIMTGNLEAQSFFPPGKVADYTGFQYLRDNDPDNMGHNTSFLTRVAQNVIYILSDSQFEQLKALAVAQMDQIDLYGYKRFPLMKAFRRLLDGAVPTGSTGLNLNAVKLASRELYLIDGQISFDRALLYANIINSFTATQKVYLDAMKGKGWNSWPNITNDQIKTRMQTLPQGTAVAVMTYAGDLFSWYAGSLDADVYFCPERQGTYYGGFYIKDAPAVGHEGYSISEQLTATAGSALCDVSKGYVTQQQAAVMSGLVDTQRNNLYAGTTNIVQTRTQIATLLRGLLVSTANSDSVKSQVLALSGTYGELDGENNYYYATVFAQVYKSLTSSQKSALATLRKSIMSGTYSDGTPFDYSVCTTPYLYASPITNQSVLIPYIFDTDYLFFEPAPCITTNPASQTVKAGASANFSVAASGTSVTFTYQWQRKASSGTVWTDLTDGGAYSGANTASLTVRATTVAMNGDQLRCVVTYKSAIGTQIALSLATCSLNTTSAGFDESTSVIAGTFAGIAAVENGALSSILGEGSLTSDAATLTVSEASAATNAGSAARAGGGGGAASLWYLALLLLLAVTRLWNAKRYSGTPDLA